MQDRPGTSSSENETGLPPTDETAAPHSNEKSRTAVAGSELFKAIKSDLAGLARGLRDRLGRLRQKSASLAGESEHHPQRGRARRSGRRVLAAFALAALACVVVVSGAILWAIRGLPIDEAVAEKPRQVVMLETAGGAPLGRLGPLKIESASHKDFAKVLVDAVISTEDRRFYSHLGVDPWGILRALRRNIAAGTIVEGGSTITQQLVKLRLLGNDRSYTRKLREALIALWLETRASKNEILTRYLNTVYLGAGAYGVPAAARLYFDKAPSELTLAESAMLAGLIKAPSKFNPLQNLEAARDRARVVLDAMVETGAITREQADAAKQQQASLNRPVEAAQADTWFADWVSKEAFGLIDSIQSDVRIRTTLVPDYQRIAEEVVHNALRKNAERGVSQAALVAMRPDGAVVAMVGGADYEESQFNRAVQAKRQPGSAFKLFVYMAALRSGYVSEDMIDARAREIDGWRPENFSGRQYGQVTLAQGFANSINTATVNLALDVGLDKVIAAARDLGIDAPLQELPSIALGSEEMSLLDLTAAYAGVMAGKAPVTPWGLAGLAPEGRQRLMSIVPPAGDQTPLGPVRSSLMHLLRLTVERGTAENAAIGGFSAGKTGTSQNNRDAWFIGFNETHIVGIWVGNDDNEPMDGVTGGSVPARIWKAFMEKSGIATRAGESGYISALTRPSPSTVEPLTQPRPDEPARERGAPPQVPREPLPEPHAPAGAPETVVAPETSGQQTMQDAPRSRCDVRACASAYRSFRASDCTYQPYGGGSRVKCEKGMSQHGGEREAAPARTSERQSQALQEQRRPSRGAGAQRFCDVELCARTYDSFRPSDCTYQPYGGGRRRICDK